MRSNDDVFREFFRSFSLIAQVGLVMAISIGVGFAGGYFLDRWLQTGFVFLVLGIVFGVAAGFWNVYRMLMKGLGPPSSEGNGSSPGSQGGPAA